MYKMRLRLCANVHDLCPERQKFSRFMQISRCMPCYVQIFNIYIESGTDMIRFMSG